MRHGSEEGAANAVGEALGAALGGEDARWMVAVWRVDAEGTLHFRRVTWAFPVGLFDEAQRQLKGSIKDEVAALEGGSKEPLPLADFLRTALGGGLKVAEVEEGNGEGKEDEKAD